MKYLALLGRQTVEVWSDGSYLICTSRSGASEGPPGEISEELEFPEKFTTYAARHSFATISYHQGKSLSLISQALGHKGELITETYLKQFENKQLDQAFCDL